MPEDIFDIVPGESGPSFQEHAILAVQKTVGPFSVARGKVRRRSVQAKNNAAAPVASVKLRVRSADAVEYRLQPGDLAVRVILIGWEKSHGLRRPADDVVADLQVFNLLAAVVPKALRCQCVVA